MKKVKQANGYIIYRANVPAKDHENYGCRLDHYNIYLATDIKDYGLTYSDPEYQDIDTLAEALNICNASYYAIACALAEELSNSTCQDMDLVQEIEKRLEAGEALESIRESYDTDEDDYYWAYTQSGKERLCSAMETAGYAYDTIDTGDYHIFRSEYGSLTFDTWLDVKYWLDGVVFDDPETADRVERILHPERFAEEPEQDSTPEKDVIYPTCPNCGSAIVTGPEDIYYDDLGWHTLCPVCDCSFDVEPKQEWLNYDYKPAELADDDEDLPPEKDELKALRAHSAKHPVTVDVYADTTDFYTEAECDQDNGASIRIPYYIVYDYTCLQAGHDVDVEAFDRWLCEYCTCDDFLDLVWYAWSKGIYPVKAGWSLADYVVRNEHRSHATYAVLRDPDTDEYETLALARREDELTKDYNDRLLGTLVCHLAFSDCGGWDVEEIVIDGIPVEYDGWRPMMEFIFRYKDTGEIIYDEFHDELDH